MSTKRNIFISYASPDLAVALAMEQWLRRTSPNIGVFLAADYTSIPLGAEWFAKISTALLQADALIVLGSAAAVRSTWVSFEAGFVASNGRPIVPVLLPPFRPEQLKPPLAFRQWIRFASQDSLFRIQKAIGLGKRGVKASQQAYRRIARACADAGS